MFAQRIQSNERDITAKTDEIMRRRREHKAKQVKGQVVAKDEKEHLMNVENDLKDAHNVLPLPPHISIK